MKLILLFILISLNVFTVISNNRPHIIWASSPVLPNETVVIQAGDFSNKAIVQLTRLKDGKPGNPNEKNSFSTNDWLDAEILQRGSSTLKCVVPEKWKPGIYACRMIDGKSFSDTIFLNAPKVWWSQGDNGETSSSGGWLRIVGNCFNSDSYEIKSRDRLVVLKDFQGKFFQLPLKSDDPFDILAHIPVQIGSGTYELWVHNGYGGKSGWNLGGKVKITNAIVPDLKVFNVKILGIETSLRKARENNGGIVYFPSGEYELMNAIDVPNNTILLGDGIEKTIIYWKDLKHIPEALLSGKSFILRNLSLYCQNMYKNVIKVNDGNFKMDSVRIRANPIFMLGRDERELEFRGRKLNGKNEDIDACIHLTRMDQFEISNCDILAGSHGLRIINSSNGMIQNSRVQYGRNGFGCEGINRVIIENCIFEGIDLAATGNYFSTYWGNSAEYLYLKGNRFANAYGLDQEFFTFDAAGGAYMGKITNVYGSNMKLASDPVFKRYSKDANDWRNTVICILDGKGCGQYRRVKSHSGRDWELERPWLIEPDTSSIITIIPFRGHTLLVNNTFEDGGAVQYYGTSIENIVFNNKGTRMSGFLVWGQEARGWGWQPSWYNQILNNQILDGHNYRHQFTRIGVMGTISEAHQGSYEGPLSKCTIIRNNEIESNGLISISGQSEDVVVENNLVKNSKFGIIVEKKSPKKLDFPSVKSILNKDLFGVLLRYNKFENVENPYSGNGMSGAKIY